MFFWIWICICIIVNLIVFFATVYFPRSLKNEKVIRLQGDENGWIPIDIFPHYFPNGCLIGTEIIITDGEKVRTWFMLDSNSFDYNSDGKPIMSTYNRSLITHWMPLPEPKK